MVDIKSLSELKYNKVSRRFNLYTPQFVYTQGNLNTYTVQTGEEMRIDLVMMSIYNDPYVLKDTDIILFLNDIDNPLNINVGDVIRYPVVEALSQYRFYIDPSFNTGENVRKQLAVPNKTAKRDQSWKKFVDNGYALPPVVLDEAKSPVRVEGDKIVIGGLNN